MSSFPPPFPDPNAHFPPLPPNQYRRPPDWFSRNWKWFVPTLVLSLLALLGGFVAVVFFSITGVMRTSDPYKLAVARATASPAVQAKLGTPLTIGKFVGGSINLNNNDGDATLTIPISGPLAAGDISVVAKKVAGQWHFDTLEVDPKNSGQPIPLLNPNEAPTPTPPATPPAASSAPDSTT